MSPVLCLEVERQRTAEDRLETGVGQRLRLEHGSLDRTLPRLVVGTGRIDLGIHHLPPRQLADHDLAALAQRHAVRARPVLGDRRLQRGPVFRQQAGIGAALARGRACRGIRLRGRLGRVARLRILQLLELLLGQARLFRRLLA